MTKAFVCDNCDDFISGYPKMIINEISDLGNIEDTHDYCEKCTKLMTFEVQEN